MITSIKFDKKIFDGYSLVGNDNLNHLNKINLLIGKNNSGKSRFLRFLLKNKIEVETTDFNSKTLNDFINDFKNYIASILKKKS